MQVMALKTVVGMLVVDPDTGTNHVPGWRDSDGAGLLCTLRKACGKEAPYGLDLLLVKLLARALLLGSERPFAADSCAMGSRTCCRLCSGALLGHYVIRSY